MLIVRLTVDVFIAAAPAGPDTGGGGGGGDGIFLEVGRTGVWSRLGGGSTSAARGGRER